KGIESTFTVTGQGGQAQAKADRTVTFDAVDFHFEHLDLTGITAGQTIRFQMTNSGDQPHEFEVLDSSGDALGEVAAVEKGEKGGATVTFEKAGTYTYQCILVDPTSKKQHTDLGMLGTFEVSA
ncbi:MAG: cupredoxin domain-containing protein, partial [Aquihabitans sp.]